MNATIGIAKMEVEINLNDNIEEEEILAIYRANNWSSAEKPKELMAALRNSHSLVTARISRLLVGWASPFLTAI